MSAFGVTQVEPNPPIAGPAPRGGPNVRRRRIRYFASHLAVSAGLVGFVSMLVLFVWYPAPLFHLDGALTILALLAAVDVIVGPVITLIIASPKKATRELMRDVTIIGAIQAAALIYGAHALFVSRPAFVVFNANRFDSVGANELARPDNLQYREEAYRSTPIFGPQWTVATPADSEDIRSDMLFKAIEGGPDIKQHPALYQPWPRRGAIDERKILPLSDLLRHSEKRMRIVQDALRSSGLNEDELGYVPLVGHEKTGTVVLNKKSLEIILVSDVDPGL